MRKRKVLFVCVHNSARSRMAEGFLNTLCGDLFEAQSAGLEAGRAVNPLAAEAMQEVGIDITQKAGQLVADVEREGPEFDYVITVCHGSDAAACPVFRGPATRLHWPFEDPAAFTGSHAEKLEQTRAVRAAIKAKIESWCAELRAGS
ncbi:MAG: arsenate reductase ArsC [Chthoniobacterales bacterium]